MDEQIAKKIAAFFTKYHRQIYKKGEVLIRADDTPPGVFYLATGQVRKYAISQKGDELVVNIFKPISFFPMSWAMNESPNIYFYEAMDTVEVWKAPKEDVLQFIRENPDVLYDLLQRVYRGTDGMETRIMYLMAGSAYTRLLTQLIITAKRFGSRNGDEVTLKISEKDLGTQTGMTRETVSREMHVLKVKNLLSLHQNTIIIPNFTALKEELETADSL